MNADGVFNRRSMTFFSCHTDSTMDGSSKSAGDWISTNHPNVSERLDRSLSRHAKIRFFYFLSGKLSIGYYDLDLRPCHQTTIDIFHAGTVQSSS